MNFKTNADFKLKCKKRMKTNVGFDVSRVLQFYCSSLSHGRVPSTSLGYGSFSEIIIYRTQTFYKNFQKLSVFQIHYFIKYITFKNTKLSAALLNDTNKKQNIFTFIIIYLINRTLYIKVLFYLCKSVHLQ